MDGVKALCFDLFNTLVTVDGAAREAAPARLMSGLRDAGFVFDEDLFIQIYKSQALECIESAGQWDLSLRPEQLAPDQWRAMAALITTST